MHLIFFFSGWRETVTSQYLLHCTLLYNRKSLWIIDMWMHSNSFSWHKLILISNRLPSDIISEDKMHLVYKGIQTERDSNTPDPLMQEVTNLINCTQILCEKILTYIFVMVIFYSSRILMLPRSNRVPLFIQGSPFRIAILLFQGALFTLKIQSK